MAKFHMIPTHLVWGLFLILPLSFLTAQSSLNNPLQPIPVENVKVEGGFWGPRVTTNAVVTVPYNLKFIEETGRMANFDRAAGVDPTPYNNNPAVGDSDVHKIFEGAARTLQQRPDLVDSAAISIKIARVVSAQQPDGFLDSEHILENPQPGQNRVLKPFVQYNAGHMFEGSCAWHEATGDTEYLNASMRFADLLDSCYGPGKVQAVSFHPEIELALVKLFKATGNQRYLDLARFFLDQRGHIHGESEGVRGLKPRSASYNQDQVPLVEITSAEGHAVCAFYTYAAMTDIAALCKDSGYIAAVDRLWEDVVGRKLYITGSSATAQYYDEGFGDPYYLPNETAYCETCSSVAAVLWFHRLALLHADTRYFDVLERTLYNGVLSGISLSGDHFFYYNPLASRGNMSRRESWNPACCQSNLVRIIPQIGSMAWATEKNTAYLNLFVSGVADLSLESGMVRFRVETDYPWDGKVRLTLEKTMEEDFTLALRIPGWAREQPLPTDLYRFAAPFEKQPTLIAGDGAAETVRTEKGYTRITKKWKEGDVIELNLPMPARRVIANERIEANLGRVALQRGPLVYCVEAIDHDGLRTNSLILDDSTILQTVRRPDLLGDVVAITATAALTSEQEWGSAPEILSQPLVAVPYYTWANRGEGYMDVWLARKAEFTTPLPATTAIHEARITTSGEKPASLEAIRDGRWGLLSESRQTPRFILEGETPWIQCEWTKPRELDHTAVYWAVDRRAQVYWGKRIRGLDLALPQAWKIFYRDGDTWKPVEDLKPVSVNTEHPYTLRLDLPNEVKFKPVITDALRLEINKSSSPSAIQEWWID